MHDPLALHPTHHMSRPDTNGRDPTVRRLLNERDPTVRRLLRGSEFPNTWFLLGLDNRDTVQDESMEAHIWLETAAKGSATARETRQACIMCFPCISGTLPAKLTDLIDHEEVCDCVTRLLATVRRLLLFGIPPAMDGSLGPIRRIAHALAVRAGSRAH